MAAGQGFPVASRPCSSEDDSMQTNADEVTNLENGIQEMETYRSNTGSIKPADTGRDAWLFLAGSFLLEALLWGFPFSFGVFQNYYTIHEPFASSPSGIPSVGTSASGVVYLGSPIVMVVLRKWPRFRRLSNVIGLLIMVLALILSSFARNVWQLLLSQGILYGIGGALSWCPCILYLHEWFVKRSGLALGIMWAGAGFGGATVPFIMEWGLNKFGYSVVLRAWAVVLLILLGPLTYYLKPRLPAPHGSKSSKLAFDFLRLKSFWIYQTSNILQGLGYFIPIVYLPAYARQLGLPSFAGPLAVALSNAALVLGTTILGSQVDKIHVTSVMAISTTATAISISVLWGLSDSLPLLFLFSMMWGFFAGAYSTSWTAIVKEIQKVDVQADTGLVFGMFLAGRGIGNVISGPLSDAILASKPWLSDKSFGYGTGYGGLMVFVTVTSMLSGVSWFARKAGWM